MPTLRIPLRKPVRPQQIYRHLEAVTSSSTTRIPLPKPIQPLHVYRHLLRAATYFPNVCRPYLQGRIKFTFRRERTRATKSEAKLAKSKHKGALEQEHFLRTKALADAKRNLVVLNAALAGDIIRFRRVLWLCFGKLGKRRRELMALFVKKQPDSPLDSRQLEEKMAAMERERQKKEVLRQTLPTKRVFDRTDPTPWVNQKLSPIEDNWDIAKLREFFSSQKQHQDRSATPAAWPRKSLPNLNPQAWVPKTDAWGRPTAARRVTKKVRLWWKSMADKMMPPLDKEEWNLLQSVAIGEAPHSTWEMPPRRPVAIPAENTAHEKFPWAAYATIPIRDVERPRSRNYTRLTGKTDDGPYSQTATRLREGSPYSNRQLRREFSRVWEASSYEQLDSTNKSKPRKKYVWGSTMAVLPAASGTQRQIFEGVDSKGQPSRKE
ncbi:uncharacterized protein CTRU02_202830 [Colletotrichum truncatum]|uniref:Uncharacterized protein n=1 Tax=Colletotrichum truncatum TaxID=5467 RepID=A0ACC3ZLS2_COLTU|nr:uncharacterized protein CTRU02_12924 [Colletotrichum truncatum]KAF6783908.1 hypothetical protein CTRU02_12924 [Colletotrichum truncatum]